MYISSRSESQKRSMAAAVMRSMETPMPKSFTWLKTRKETTTAIRASGRVRLPPIQRATAAAIMATLAICSTASWTAV